LNAEVLEPRRLLDGGGVPPGFDLAQANWFYHNVFLPPANVAPEWNGDVATGDAGTLGPDYLAAITARINAYRWMAGLPGGITLDRTENAEDQQDALMTAANQQLNHHPPSTWIDYTAAGADAAAHSDLYLGLSGTSAIDGYMIDPGGNNTIVGHRRWILYPPTQTMGVGDIPGQSNSLWVIQSQTTPVPDVSTIAWPPAGFVPYSLIPDRWSAQAPYGSDFSNATVSVTENGVSQQIEILSNSGLNYGGQAIVWDMPNATPPQPGEQDVYNVQIHNAVIDGQTQSISYTTKTFDPSTTTDMTPVPAQLGLLQPTAVADGTNQSVTIEVARSINADQQASVAYATADGSARVGVNYVATSGTLTFAPGQFYAQVIIPILPGNAQNPGGVFSLVLSSPVGATIGPIGSAEISTDAELYPPGPPPQPDPPALVGPSGYGQAKFVSPGDHLGYKIDFSNDPNAQSSARYVAITEQLSANLDWWTFQLGAIAFGNDVVDVPSGYTSYSDTVDATATLGVYVDINAKFDPTTGLLSVTFRSLDPTTMQPPENPLIGFLPPNTNAPNGEGYVTYTIQPGADASNDATISAQASVLFNSSAAIATPEITNTTDASPPTSTVAALPATTSNTTFTVAWSGSDGKGPGIASYAVYASDNGGAYTLWQSGTTDTSATYTGQVGHTYRFYSIATDDVGLVQPTPASAPATTKVVLAPPPAVIMTNVVGKTNKKQQVIGLLVTFSGAVNATEADRIATYHLATPGKGGSYTAKNAGVINLKSASYNAAKETVTLTPTKPFALSKPVELVVYASGPNGLQDAHGRYIDGGHNPIAILSSGGTTIEAVSLAVTDRQRTETAAAIDALLARDGLAGLRNNLRVRREQRPLRNPQTPA